MNIKKTFIEYQFSRLPVYENDKDASYQLMRTGYFKRLNVSGKEIVSEIVSLKDNFNK